MDKRDWTADELRAFETRIGEIYLDNQLPFLFHLSGGNEEQLIEIFKDIRPDYGSTSTILTEHLRAVDMDISEKTATAMLYAIKSDTLFFNRHTNRADIEAFSYLYPLADAALIRKMEGAEITDERLDAVMIAHRSGRLQEQVFCAFLGAMSLMTSPLKLDPDIARQG